jgi:hypothetical protein
MNSKNIIKNIYEPIGLQFNCDTNTVQKNNLKIKLFFGKMRIKENHNVQEG